MILKIEQNQSILKKLKQKIYLFEYSLLKQAIKPLLQFQLIFSFLSFIPIVSVMFLDQPLELGYLNKCFAMFLPAGIEQIFNFSPTFVLVFMICSQLILILSVIIKVFNPFWQSYFTKFLYVLIRFFVLFATTYTAYAIQNIKTMWNQSKQTNYILSIIMIVFHIIILPFIALFIKLEIYPLRKNNKKWRISNQTYFYSFILSIVRTLMFYSRSYNKLCLSISLVCQLYLRNIPNQQLHKKMRQMRVNQCNLIILTHVALLLQSFTMNKSFASQFFLLLYLAIIIKGLVQYFNQKKQQEYIPLCNSKSSQFYDFFYEMNENSFLSQNNSSKQYKVMPQKQQEKQTHFYQVHLINCKDKKCILKNFNFSSSHQAILQQLKQICHCSIQSNKQNSKSESLIFELWKFQLGLKNNFIFKQKNQTIFQEYIFSVLQIATKFTGANDIIATNNALLLKTTFLDKLQYSSELYSKFYQQIAKPEPKLDRLLNLGSQISQIIKSLQIISSSLIKNNGMNFKLAELYMEFKNYTNVNFDKNNIQNIKKIQKNLEILELEDLYLPAITFNPENGSIENINEQCASYLNLTKSEIKSKNIIQLTYPSFQSIDNLLTFYQKNNNKKIQTFLKKGKQQQYQFGKIHIKQKFNQNKKLCYFLIEKQTYSPFKNVLLINKKTFQLIQILKTSSLNSYNSKTQNLVQIDWFYLFQKHLKPKLNVLLKEKVLKISAQEFDCDLMLSFSQSIISEYFLIKVKYIKNLNSKLNRNSSMFLINQLKNGHKNVTENNPKFEFFYDLKQDQTNQIVLCGTNNQWYRDNRLKINTKSLGKIQKQMRSLLVFKTIMNEKGCSNNIKTYRLWEKQLYNIDLQDKEGYNQQFQQHIFQNNQKSQNDEIQRDYYLIIAAVLICSAAMLLSFYMVTCASDAENTIINANFEFLQLKKLYLYLIQIVGFTRDAQSGLYSKYGLNWKLDVFWSYEKIQQIRNNSPLFSSIDRTIIFNGNKFTGNSNQLLDTLLQKIYLVASGAIDVNNIQSVHSTVVIDFTQIIQDQFYLKEQIILKEISYLSNIQTSISIVFGISTFLYFLIIGWIIKIRKEQIQKNLKSIMMISDNFAIQNMQNADQLKYAAEMIKKNFELDIKSLLQQNIKVKYRKKPKYMNIGIQKKILLVLIFLTLTSFNIWFIVNLTVNFKLQMNQINSTLNDSQNILDTYIQAMEISNYIAHVQTANITQIQQIQTKLTQIMISKQKCSFNNQLNQFFNMILFQNSCEFLISEKVFQNQTINCQKSTPGYMIQNPLQIGIIYYLRKIHYNLITNISDTYAATGIFSKQFVSIYTKIADLMKKFNNEFFTSLFQKIKVEYVILISISVIYIIIAFLVSIITKSFVKQVQQVVNFFSMSIKNQETKQKAIENKPEVKRKQRYSSVKSIDENSSLNSNLSTNQRESLNQVDKK